MKAVAVLFARADSIYKTFPECDVWDIERDARLYVGDLPIVAHPPCRAWGGLRHFAKPRPDEKDLARFAVRQVQRVGGVLEHPARSTLWDDQHLPKPGQRPDTFGGWACEINQCWFGHKAKKPTWLYVVGCEPMKTPKFEICLAPHTHRIRSGKGPQLPTNEREKTPPALARWLVDLAARCVV
jgi:hypothetical protein